MINDRFTVVHSFGQFNAFVVLKTAAIAAALEKEAGDFVKEEFADTKRLFGRLAQHYNGLSDTDFYLFGEGEEQRVIFPSGFHTKNGEPIYLYCVPNKREAAERFGASAPWFCQTVFFDGKPYIYERQVAHSHGQFKAFVSVNTASIAWALEQNTTAFSREEDMGNKHLYGRLAQHYNELHDEDFHFFEEGGERRVIFPTGFCAEDGEPISLYCVPYKADESDGRGPWEWYTNSVWVRGGVYRSVFDDINANWYDIREAMQKIVSGIGDDEEAVSQLVQKIEIRCKNKGEAYVFLKEGKVCQWAEADELYVPTGCLTEDGRELYLRCTKSLGDRDYGWYFSNVTYAAADFTVFKKKDWMEKWGGVIGNDMLGELANQTLDEVWSFPGREAYGILKNYLRYTFANLWEDGQIAYSVDGKYAVFNTGLPELGTYKYLYALFERDASALEEGLHPLFFHQSYVLKEFLTVGGGGMGKVLAEIRPLPAPAQYFKARSETVWELSLNDSNEVEIPYYDHRHILIDGCERLPLDFYRYGAQLPMELRQLLDADVPASEKYKGLREFLKPMKDLKRGRPDPELSEYYGQMVGRLKTVIENAVKKLSWNWRSAVPCYNPEAKSPCFLLPVAFSSSAKPDRAMIATVTRNGAGAPPSYQIHTVIPLDWAYLDARLVCRPESEWLAAGAFAGPF